MATLTQNVMTLLEQAKRRYNGEVQKIAEILNRINDIIGNVAAYEANDVHSHTVTKRHRLPTINERAVNEGASSGISQVRQYREDLTVLDSIVQMDELLYDPEPDFREFLMTEIAAQLEGTMQTFATRFIYGDRSSNPKTINGLATRYNALAANSVVSAGGSGSDLTSVWLIETGKNAFYLFYPKGSSAGIKTKDIGEATLYDASSNPYRGYEYQVQMKFGMAIPDDRAIKRLANIESTGESNNIRADAVTANLTLLTDQLPSFGRNAVVLANRTTKGQMDVWALNKSNAAYTLQQLEDGTMITRFNGMPVIIAEAILDTESALT